MQDTIQVGKTLHNSTIVYVIQPTKKKKKRKKRNKRTH